ncbi:DUF551 domain-containing protein [Klebsiella pneumoniae]|uniref:DUF551 domain-containing protein n=1 Tax=Klebsiella pneumoniae TaxID=573 RepID=UPI000DFFCB2B|nr:DUF551 domain-containing protein [Klebsiella pneumoniae]EKW9396960.1 DUF551 domain-containing protein [Klebsiella pneumoniae]MBZ1947826.1 DUF551 domain-containing protein [Klebsiella pneumoniae]MCQ0462579.1 DUF551 domain-containing protein [Klebsiella pneumoniae]STV57013.1 Eaa1 [Klebsiella pneumoniae]VGK28678.1 Eaa1 [Klebsiella pneumoniae]
MTKSTITRERAQQIFLGNGPEQSASEERELARMTLVAMDSEPVELPLDYLQGHKDGLEWAAQLAEANHPETGDWLYDDPIELAKAIRKGPDMPPSQPALDTEPVAYTDERNLGYIDRGRETAYLWGKQNSEASDVALYRHAQPAQVVPEEATPDSIEILASGRCRDHVVYQWDEDQRNAAADSWNACRAAMLEADPQLPGSDSAPVPGSWIPVSERMPERGDYLVTDGCDFDVQLFNGEQFIPGFVWEDKITHWMPLPAAPKEVKGE